MSSNDGGNDAPGALGRLAALGRQMIPSVPFMTSAAPDAAPQRRGTLRLGPNVELPVFAPHDETRLPDQRLLLDLTDPVARDHLEWLGRKYSLRQDAL